MAKPLVAIVGRPNVGKSTFFNQMAGRRIAIVDDTPGVTRDRVYADCEWQNHSFTLIDTGGIDPGSDDPLLSQMRRQAEIAIETCDVILFFVDGRAGLTADDQDVADMLRKSGKPVMLVVNKVDNVRMMDDIYEFYNLGMGDPMGISSVNLMNFGDLLEELCRHFPAPDEEEEEGGAIQIAVAGKPNVGKSSLVNCLLGEDRVMVSDIAGTTRDAIDTRMTAPDGQEFVLIDTAGIRRKRAIAYQSLERFSIVRALAAIDRCDVALLVIDATQGVTEQDSKIAGYIDEKGKAAVIVVNKWDAVEKDTGTMNEFIKKIREELKFMAYAPTLFISAKTGQRVDRVLDAVRSVYAQAVKRVTTGLLNDILADAQAALQPPATSGRRLKIYYATQQGVQPPTFVMFVNDQTLMHFSYERYLEGQFRKAFGFEGTPLRFILREREKKNEA
ncbi:MAG: ribosome biogenesis GTPase Der [Clostridia bacterium]|nr:ribosome biogenesis GTPase Der [Clostridia bacterium]